jgi:hypothetical protein
MNELNIDSGRANSSPGQGACRKDQTARCGTDSVRSSGWLESRFMDGASAFLPQTFMEHNLKFARVPRRPDNLHRPLNRTGPVARCLCLRDERAMSARAVGVLLRAATDHSGGERVTRGLVGKSSTAMLTFPDGRLGCWQGISLPYSIFDRSACASRGDHREQTSARCWSISDRTGQGAPSRVAQTEAGDGHVRRPVPQCRRLKLESSPAGQRRKLKLLRHGPRMTEKAWLFRAAIDGVSPVTMLRHRTRDISTLHAGDISAVATPIGRAHSKLVQNDPLSCWRKQRRDGRYYRAGVCANGV